MVDLRSALTEIRDAVDARFEWLLVRTNARTFPLTAEEIEFTHLDDRLQISFVDDLGFHTWRLNSFEFVDGEISLDVAGSFGRNRETMRLVPRSQAAELSQEVELARLRKANEVARLIEESQPGTKLTRVAQSRTNSRYAQIIFSRPGGPGAALADVSGLATAEELLIAALLWQAKLSTRQKNPVGQVLIVAEKYPARHLQKLQAMLREPYKSFVAVAEIVRKDDNVHLKNLPQRRVSDLWREKPRKLVLPSGPRLSAAARELIALAPDKIDAIFSAKGATLRFEGLPFARTRNMLGRDRMWFGVGTEKRIADGNSKRELTALVETLSAIRNSAPASKRHDFYRQAPEAWLESILRRNIKLLDANLILSPIYNQFRTSNDKIDLLALRRDGRLVIIELKTKPDRQMVFQAADYWRKIELQRRKGQLEEIRAFGDKTILDKPALVYLVAPALSFHRDFAYFAGMLADDIEMWRFELHENWREEIKVITRRSYGRAGGTYL